mgnify:CR=1 FL=1
MPTSAWLERRLRMGWEAATWHEGAGGRELPRERLQRLSAEVAELEAEIMVASGVAADMAGGGALAGAASAGHVGNEGGASGGRGGVDGDDSGHSCAPNVALIKRAARTSRGRVRLLSAGLRCNVATPPAESRCIRSARSWSAVRCSAVPGERSHTRVVRAPSEAKLDQSVSTSTRHVDVLSRPSAINPRSRLPKPDCNRAEVRPTSTHAAGAGGGDVGGGT